MREFQIGDQVRVNINAGRAMNPLWVKATVTHPLDLKYGWTMARTNSDSTHPGIERGPGWMPGEILAEEDWE